MASETGKFIVYKSSAGSGKTFTLVREYLRIVLQNPEQFRQVLAITFTNKAANEMKERVIRNLVILSDFENHGGSDAVKYLLPQLAEQLNYTFPQIKSRAALVLRLIIHHYAEFAISTIDSFTHRVIRTFAHDLKIPMNFDVELDADTLLSESVDLLISQVGSNDQITRVIVDFVEKKAGDELNWQIEKDLNEFGKTLVAESGIPAIAEIRGYDLDTFMNVRKNLFSWKSSWESRIIIFAREAVGLMEGAGVVQQSLCGQSRGILPYFQNLADKKFDKLQPNDTVRNSLESGEWIHSKASPDQRSAFDLIAPRVIPIGKSLLELIDKDLQRYTLCRLLLDYLYSTALLSEIEKTLDALCLENNKLLISEFNRRISRIVREQPAPFIYERLGEKYHHYLIDEFQDTSVLQWHNLLPLIENSLASFRMNLVVGDAKQAIYRWRSGDAEQFEMLPKLLRNDPDPLLDGRERALINHYKEEILKQNHRSSPVIVEFNNRLFTCIAGLLPEPYGKAFGNAIQETAKKDKPGMVRIEKIAEGEDDKISYEERVHNRIFSIIGDLQEDRFPLKDVAILCRDNTRASKIASFLIRQGIPVISSESLLLTQSEQVNFLVAWMRHLTDPSDGIPMAQILWYITGKGLLTGIKMEDYFGKNAPAQAEGFRELIGHFPDLGYDRLKNLEIFGLVQYLIFQFDLNRLNDSYLQFFRDMVLEFVKDSRGGTAEFLEWWDARSDKASVVIPEGINAVRIMTIHKAKGLQFPVVIYPFADEKLRATRKNLWVPLDEDFAKPLKTAYLPVQKTLEGTIYSDAYKDEMNRSFTDMVNVLYVALTRPEERLYVLTKEFPEKTDGAPSVPKLFSSFLLSEGTWEKGRDAYQWGERWQRTSSAVAEEDVSVAESPVSRASLKMLLRRHAPQAWDIENPERNREWGNLVHLAMSLISRADQAEAVLQEMLFQGLISSSQKNDLSVLMGKILDDPEIGFLFSPAYEVRNEPEILTAGGELYRPDRVLVSERKVTLIDYKTGMPRDSHRYQINEYVKLMNEMNYTVDGAYLLYLNREPQLLKVI